MTGSGRTTSRAYKIRQGRSWGTRLCATRCRTRRSTWPKVLNPEGVLGRPYHREHVTHGGTFGVWINDSGVLLGDGGNGCGGGVVRGQSLQTGNLPVGGPECGRSSWTESSLVSPGFLLIELCRQGSIGRSIGYLLTAIVTVVYGATLIGLYGRTLGMCLLRIRAIHGATGQDMTRQEAWKRALTAFCCGSLKFPTLDH